MEQRIPAMGEGGRVVYDNTPTVVAVLVPYGKKLLAIRRGNDPGKGLLGLPGGYHMRGETWQEAGAREVLEETGITIRPDQLRLISMETDEYGNNLVIARCPGPQRCVDPITTPEEVQEIVYLEKTPRVKDVAFPRHHYAMLGHFRGWFDDETW
ncbi:NUDIX domain-containing protein [Nitratireductor sp. B36]|uniref:NUDIX domain-containing protein n=1 Tax=Nitratireductor sp. B36 TaxID=2762059 RepID=UPI001E479D31|nr:NUDIX domain-containing protein [Nitratireductor sp. B36]MCC5780525.1 NUDIX domain-containing protein [Nitratireductor sp. B36]